LIAVLLPASLATAQSLHGVPLGASGARLQTLPFPLLAREADDTAVMSKFQLADGSQRSVTLDRRLDSVRYIEVDRAGVTGSPLQSDNGLRLEQTTLSDIRRRFDGNGFSWPRLAMRSDEDRLIAMNAYPVRSVPDAVVVFVTVVEIAELQDAGMTGDRMGDLARLDAVIPARSDYLDTLWGSERIADPAALPIDWP